MIKDGELRENSTPCDICGQPSTCVVGQSARCVEHQVSEDKQAEADIHLKSFTAPLETFTESPKGSTI